MSTQTTLTPVLSRNWDAGRAWSLSTTDQLFKAEEYEPLIVSYKSGTGVRLGDVASVVDSVEDLRAGGLANGKPAVLLIIFRQPGANIIATVDRIRAVLPQLQASIPPAIDLQVVVDSTTTIRASVHDVELTLVLSISLVILVVFLFLRNWRSTLIPSVAVPVSLIGTFGVMYLLGYSIDNLSLMAMTIATGFVVDDAIVVIENITRHLEAGMRPFAAALKGAQEIGFTVISISLSLIAVFIPILMMGGIVGRLFREFAVTLSVAILVSLLVSLTTTPMMCAKLLRAHDEEEKHGRLFQASERGFQWVLDRYEGSLAWVLRHQPLILLVTLLTMAATVYLYIKVPKGFFPQQDTGRLTGSVQADQASSFQAMQTRLTRLAAIVQRDPAIDTVTAFTGGNNSGRMFIALQRNRKITADQVIARLRPQLSHVPGANLFLQPVQDLRVGGRSSGAQYQYTLQGDDAQELLLWAPRVMQRLRTLPQLVDVNSDQQNKGLESNLVIDRDAAARLGITVSQIDNTLYDAFGQRQVSTIYVARNQYHVIMEVAPRYWQNPETLKDVYVSTSGGSVGGSQATNAVAGTVAATTTAKSAAATSANAQAARNLATNSIGATGKGVASTGSAVSTNQETMIPLAAVARFTQGATPLAVNHQGLLVANTISFNLPPNVSLSTAIATIEATMNRIGVPATIRGTFQGTAKAFQDSLSNQPFLILAALVTIYIVLGVLYESYVHPLTILSTLPSAGVGALLALMAFNTEFSIMSLIGVILLIGIVKKNAIMMIDFALDAERRRGLSPLDAIREACLLRFRPIMMTTMAAMLGALPLAVGLGEGGELRQPLGIAIVGGLILSQVLTLYSTPVIYLYLDRFRLWSQRLRGGGAAPHAPGPSLQPGE